MPVKKDKTGRIIVDNFCRIKEPSLNNVYAIGDCANFEEFTTPPTAQAAEQEGKYIAKLLNDKVIKFIILHLINRIRLTKEN